MSRRGARPSGSTHGDGHESTKVAGDGRWVRHVQLDVSHLDEGLRLRTFRFKVHLSHWTGYSTL